MPRQQGPRRLIIIAKERPFDADKWQQLLTAFAYVLHEQRKQCAVTDPTDANNQTPTKDEP